MFARNLLETHRTRTLHIEFTSRCNLRCVFCCASQPGYQGTDLEPEILDNLIRSIKKQRVKVLSVNGHGETTIYPNWHRHCNQLLDIGAPLHIISNFARPFSDEEIRTLARFKTIEISCDTADPGLFRKMRRGAELHRIYANIKRLESAAEQQHRRWPEISFSCVVSDKNVLGLKDYVVFGKRLGVSHFNFCNLTKYPDIPGALQLNHITEMPAQLLPAAEASLMETFDFLDASGISYHVQQGLLDSLREKIQSLKNPRTPAAAPKPGTEPGPEPEIHRYSCSQAPRKDMTRDCLDPWSFVLVQSDREVLPCCWHPPIGTLGKRQHLSEVINNTIIKELRYKLLNGDLPDHCQNCPTRGWTTTKKLQKKVRRYLNPLTGWLSFASKAKIERQKLNPLAIRYGHGWYPMETDNAINQSQWQQWRWTAKRAVCLLPKPKRDALLILRGGVDKLKHRDQHIRVLLDGELMDEFVPPSGKFSREYVVTPRMMGQREEVPLVIETDKTFVPDQLNPGCNDTRELGVQFYEMFFGEI